MADHLLSWMTFAPVIGAAVIAGLPGRYKDLTKWIAAAATAVPLLLAAQLFLQFDRTTANMQFTEHYTWIKSFNIEYFLGVDGLSVRLGDKDAAFSVRLRGETCSEAMTGTLFAWSVVVDANGQSFKGCAWRGLASP